jgi:DNA-binding MarR family transcriptional regulator
MKKLETKFDKAEGSVGFLFWKTANLHQRLQRAALKDLDLTPTQFSILACYFFLQKEEDELPSQADVCKHSGLDKMHVSDTTNALLKKKLLTKKMDKNDRRAYLIELTDHGKTICNKAVKIIEILDDEFFSASNNKKNFHSMLEKINEHFNKAD